MDNWHSKYDKNGMEVWVETAAVPQGSKKSAAKVHKIKVSRFGLCLFAFFLFVCLFLFVITEPSVILMVTFPC